MRGAVHDAVRRRACCCSSTAPRRGRDARLQVRRLLGWRCSARPFLPVLVGRHPVRLRGVGIVALFMLELAGQNPAARRAALVSSPARCAPVGSAAQAAMEEHSAVQAASAPRAVRRSCTRTSRRPDNDAGKRTRGDTRGDYGDIVAHRATEANRRPLAQLMASSRRRDAAADAARHGCSTAWASSTGARPRKDAALGLDRPCRHGALLSLPLGLVAMARGFRRAMTAALLNGVAIRTS